MSPEAPFNQTSFVLLSLWSTSTLVLVAALSLGIVGLAWHNVRLQPRPRRYALLTIRGLAVLLLFGLFLQPGLRKEHVTRVRNHVAVVVDTSRSMALPGEHGTRMEDTLTFLRDAKSTFDGWAEAHVVDLYAFSEHATPVGSVDELAATGDVTRLLPSLADVSSRHPASELAAVVVVSDGADNGALSAALSTGPGAAPAVSELASRLGAPVHTFFTGPKEAPRDVAISAVRYDDFAFVHNAVSIEVEVEVNGYGPLSLPVTLYRDEVELGRRVIETRPDERVYSLAFEFVPDRTGKAVFTLDVGTAPDETIRVNNRRQFVIRIIRDKIRVLQVVGRPSWDERFLRQLLKKNPNVDLISFFILRTSGRLMLVPRDELSLIPFPTQELFEEQLGSFDLVIFQNFTFRGYQMEQYLPHIRDFVRNGGGFVMIGGDLSFSSGGFAGTPLEDILPVSLPAEGTPGSTDLLRTDRFIARLAPGGIHHPITSLARVPEENAAAWESLPELSGTNRTGKAREGAVVLLEHPTLTEGGAAVPIVVASTVGKGRVIAVTTDSTWHWDLMAAGEGGDNRHYYRFWGNAIRWLIKDPALEPVRVTADRDRYSLGADVTVTARVFGRDYQPAADVAVRLEVERSPDVAGGAVTQIRQEELKTNALGEAVLTFAPVADGGYRVRARALIEGAEASAEDPFVVAADPVELRETKPRLDTLTALSESSGGTVNPLDVSRLAAIQRKVPTVSRVNRRQDVPLWADLWMLLLAVSLPSLEWYLRRRWGLL
ncbi:MAG: hypothetical protein EXR76_05170 [Myxococcales bacterium]|nr:hypothetical protein [Myxococcales bacterium]